MDAASFPLSYCLKKVYDHNHELYLSLLYLPQSIRSLAFSLYALHIELEEIRKTVSSPMLGEIRFQWWYDELESRKVFNTCDHPILQLIDYSARSFNLDRNGLLNYIETERTSLYQEPFKTLDDYEIFFNGTYGNLLLVLHKATEKYSKQSHLANDEVNGTENKEKFSSLNLKSSFLGNLKTISLLFGAMDTLKFFPHHIRYGRINLPSDILDNYYIDREALLSGRNVPNLKEALQFFLKEITKRCNSIDIKRTNLNSLERRLSLPLTFFDFYKEEVFRKAYDPLYKEIKIPLWKKHLNLWRNTRS